jgi:hypothetical protein
VPQGGRLGRIAGHGSPSCKDATVVVRQLKKPRAAPGHSWPVSKTMQADARGAVKLTRRFGASLICVRYRLSPDGRHRITTVELEVDRVEVQKKSNPPVAVKIYPSEAKLIACAMAKGARFDGKTRLWRMHQNDAYALGLGKRIARAEEHN